jgi:hypothetical protein
MEGRRPSLRLAYGETGRRPLEWIFCSRLFVEVFSSAEKLRGGAGVTKVARRLTPPSPRSPRNKSLNQNVSITGCIAVPLQFCPYVAFVPAVGEAADSLTSQRRVQCGGTSPGALCSAGRSLINPPARQTVPRRNLPPKITRFPLTISLPFPESRGIACLETKLVSGR